MLDEFVNGGGGEDVVRFQQQALCGMTSKVNNNQITPLSLVPSIVTEVGYMRIFEPHF